MVMSRRTNLYTRLGTSSKGVLSGIENADGGRQRQQYEQIMAELEQESPRSADLIRWTRVEGRRYREIADHLGVQVDELKMELFKVHRMLYRGLLPHRRSSGNYDHVSPKRF